MRNSIIFLTGILLVSCNGSYKFDSQQEIYNFLHQNNINPTVLFIIPNRGCAGCISTAEEFFINHDKLEGLYFVFTNIISKKYLLNQLGENCFKSRNVLFDTLNSLSANSENIYPQIIYFNKKHKIQRIDIQRPGSDALDKLMNAINEADFTIQFHIDLRHSLKKRNENAFGAYIKDNISFIKLKPPLDDYLTNPNNFKGTKDRYYFTSNNKLYIYNKNGEFIRAIGNTGRGPNEISSLLDYTIDRKNNLYYLLDYNGKKIAAYNCENEIVKVLTSFNSADIELFNRDLLIILNDQYSGTNEKIFDIVDLRNDSVEFTYYHKSKNVYKYAGLHFLPYIYDHDNLFYFKIPFDDTIRYLSSNFEIFNHGIITAGNLIAPPRIQQDIQNDDILMKYISNISFYESNREMFCRFYYKNRLFLSMVNKITGKTICSFSLSEKDFKPQNHFQILTYYFWPQYCRDNVAFGIILPGDIPDYVQKDLNINETNNPLIFYYPIPSFQ